LPLVTADIVFSRTVNSVSLGSGSVTIGGAACKSKDQYGSNECDLHWGSNYSISIDVALGTDIVAGHQITIDTHLDSIIPFKFSCPLCGSDCSVTVPIVKKKVSITLPPCPIKKGPLKLTTTLALPGSAPVPLKASFKGKATVNDPSGATVADIDFQGDASPSAMVEGGGQCAKAAYAFCCGVGQPCDCTKGTTSPGQCKPESYTYCCDVGTPCDCTKPGLATFLA